MAAIDTLDSSCDGYDAYSSGEESIVPQHRLSAPEGYPFGAFHRRMADRTTFPQRMMLPIASPAGTRLTHEATGITSAVPEETSDEPRTFLEQIRFTEQLVKRRLRNKMRVRRRRVIGRVYLSVVMGNDPHSRLALHTVLHLEHRQTILKTLHRLRGAEDPIKSLVYSLYARRLTSSHSEGEIFLMKNGMLEPETMTCEVMILMMNDTIRPISAVLEGKQHAKCYEQDGCHNIHISIYPQATFSPVTSSQVVTAMIEYNTHTSVHFNSNYNRLASILGKDDNRNARIQQQLAAQAEMEKEKGKLLEQVKERYLRNSIPALPQIVDIPTSPTPRPPVNMTNCQDSVIEEPSTSAASVVRPPDLYSAILKRPPIAPPAAPSAAPVLVAQAPATQKEVKASKSTQDKRRGRRSGRRR